MPCTALVKSNCRNFHNFNKAFERNNLEAQNFVISLKWKFADLHRRHNHLERFFPGCAHSGTEHLDVRKHFENILVEAEISNAARNATIFDEERSIARHAGENFLIRIDFADVPEARYQDSALRRANHFVEGLVTAGKNQIHGRFAIFIGQGKTVTCRLLFHFFRGGARVHEIFWNAAIHQQNLLPRNAFPVVWVHRAGMDGRRRPKA